MHRDLDLRDQSPYLQPYYRHFKPDDQRSISSISSLTSRSMATDAYRALAHQRPRPVDTPLKQTQARQASGHATQEQKASFPHHKAGRVKVGIRCRPPFEDEIEGDAFQPSVIITSAANSANGLAIATLTLMSGKNRDFYFDYGFEPHAGQDEVYDTLAKPVVADVLRGFNGTIFAYGQTGTGKTYTMGILEMVQNEHAGIIPRALAQIFNHVYANKQAQCTITVSFLQLYRETIQDLLSPSYSDRTEMLGIREDPHKGFYVEGLQEYTVRSYEEAEALVNLGLQNRAMAPTLMNTTSSRSHTILTVSIEQREFASTGGRPDQQPHASSRTLRSKLLLVDLAGSERVRRTVSKGVRLDEAKSINTSLSALGNVIAALASASTGHIPYRDSKLTRLLQDSLGGTASTALIATVGPAAISGGETLSTLLFASRCMAVKANPIQHEEVNYGEMYARLQARFSTLEREYMQKLEEQEERHQTQMRNLQQQFQRSAEYNAQLQSASMHADDRLDELFHVFEQDTNLEGWEMYHALSGRQGVAAMTMVYHMLCAALQTSVAVLKENQTRQQEYSTAIAEQLESANEQERFRAAEHETMAKFDPMKLEPVYKELGPHIAPISTAAALNRVNNEFPTNNSVLHNPQNGDEAHFLVDVTVVDPFGGGEPPELVHFESPQHFFQALHQLGSALTQNMQGVNLLMGAKDSHFNQVKQELATQAVDKRQREEEVVNWSYVLKYLLATNSKLRKQLQHEQKVQSYTQQTPEPSTPSDTDMYLTQTPPSAPRAHLSPVERVRLRSRLNMEASSPTPASKLGYRALGSREAIAHNRAVGMEFQQPSWDVEQTPVLMPRPPPGAPRTEHSRNYHTPILRDNARSENSRGYQTPASASTGKSEYSVERLIKDRLSITDEAEAQATTTVIERIMQFTPQQLERMSPNTRAKIQQVKSALQLDKLDKPKRSRSAEPRERSSSRHSSNRPSSAKASYATASYHEPAYSHHKSSSITQTHNRPHLDSSYDDNYSAIDELDG